jgi:hypothetical protein
MMRVVRMIFSGEEKVSSANAGKPAVPRPL